jgi:hypothetical protein
MLMSVSVSAELDGPFLVSSSKSFIWVADKFPSGVVRLAVRKATLPGLWEESISFVQQMSLSQGWGSAAPATREGARNVVSHLSDYGLSEVEAVVSPGFDTSTLPPSISVQEEAWVTPGWALILPLDRSFLGTSFDFGDGQACMVLHNASRAMGVLYPLEEP